MASMLRAVEPAMQQCKQLLAVDTRVSAEGCLKSMPSLNTLRHDAATAVRLFAADAQQSHASEGKDPGFGGVASGAMPEAPEQPREAPNQKAPGFHLEVPAQTPNDQAVQQVAPQVPAKEGETNRLPDPLRPGAEDTAVNDPEPRHTAASEAVGGNADPNIP